PAQVLGLTLVDGRDGAFQPLVLGQYRLIHSGDVKIYENLDVLPRALLLSDWLWQADAADVWAAMEQDGFDPGRTAVLRGDGPPPSSQPVAGEVEIIDYEPERVVMRATVSDTAVLLLTDAFYPGWQAMVDGELLPVYQADGLFRAIILESGTHEIMISYSGQMFAFGKAVSLIAWIILVIFIGWEFKKRP
ncbi:MAG: YfhO family protein, partial [Anaerolineae bacterium]